MIVKFTNGYWLLRKEMEPAYAVEYASHQIEGSALTVYLPSKHISGRGDCLNIPMLTLTLSSPMEGVIKVSAVHHAGALYKGPIAQVNQKDTQVEITETDTQVIYRSGSLRAVIDKAPSGYKMAFYEGEKFLTESSFRNLAHMYNNKTEKAYMLEQLSIDVDEYIYGLGERFTPFVKNGQVVEMWNEDGGTASEIAYKNIPFYVTNKGYGVLVDNLGDVAFEIASEKVERIQFSVEGERLDYYFISGGSPMGTVEKYTDLTGKPALPPAWSFGLWLTTSFTTNYDEETTSSFIQGMADRKIPLHVFHFDCYWMDAYEWCNFIWDPKTFPDPKGMLKRYHDRGLKICVWINPYIGQKSVLFKEGMEKGYLVKKKDGSVWQSDLWQPGMGLVDFTNPDAAAWYQAKLKTLLDMGVDCFKTDFGERIPVKDIEYFDHSDPVKMHNYYTYLYNKTVFELLERERGKGEAVLFARSATVGGQQFPAHWGGDCSATYVSMAETLRGGLSLSLGGFGFWSHDISGFESTATPDIYKRWCQFGLLSSHSRLHGSGSYRVPWLFDEEACDILREFVNLKCRLMPYIYGQAVKSHVKGTPLLRPMFLDFPQDRACDTLDCQYMLGDSLLVAPVFKESGEVDYYLPEGTWVNILTREKKTGGKWIKETHDYHSLPVMLRPNTVLPMGNNDQVPDYDFTDQVTLVIGEFEEGARTCVEIPDTKGNTIMKVQARREGEEILLSVEGGKGNFQIKNLGSQTVKVES